MSPRARRLLAAAVAVVILLYSGRWLADFVTSRWWAAAISPEAEAAVTRWQFLGLALDAGAVAIASCWFAAQALIVARAIGSVQVQRHVGNELVRERVPTRWLVVGAIALGILLGVLTGAGAAAWRAPLLLALNTPRYGVADPLLGVDLGVLVARYPLWQAAHGFVLMLVVLGLAVVLGLYAAIGAFTRRDRRVELHPDARRHLGGLLSLLALTAAAGFLLTPYRLATSIDVPLGQVAGSTRVLAAHFAAGAALAAAALSVLWALRARFSLLVGGWLVLGIATTAERLVVPAFVAAAGPAGERAALQRQMDSVFHGIALTQGHVASDTLPRITALWDEEPLRRWANARGERVLAIASRGLRDAPELVVVSTSDSALELRVTSLSPGEMDARGRPAMGNDASTVMQVPRSIPGVTDWSRTGTGIRVGRGLRPLAMAWSLQAPGILNLPRNATIDWLRDPRERVTALIPTLRWFPMGLTYHDGRLAWVVSGMATVRRAPLTTRVALAGQTLSGVVPSMIALVTAESGAVRFFPDPSAGPLGIAWQQAFRGLLSPIGELPGSIVGGLQYPVDWFELQLAVLSQPHWNLGVLPTPEYRPVTVWTPSPGALQATMEESERGSTLRLLTALRRGGEAVITVNTLPPGTPSSSDLATSWSEMPTVVQLVDSLRAAGDTAIHGAIRWHQGAAGAFAWRPLMSGGTDGSPAILWLGTASASRVGGGRRTSTAWASVLGDTSGTAPDEVADETGRTEAIRTWMRRADSALARGDLTAFARGWEALRGLLADSVPR